MIDYLAELESELSVLRNRISEIETAARVIRDMDRKRLPTHSGAAPAVSDGVNLTRDNARPKNGVPDESLATKPSQPVDSSPTGWFVGKTVKETAVAVLGKSGEPMHYAEVYKVALDGGYKSGRGNGGSAETFWSIMKRDPATFEAVGSGKFKLKEA